MVPGIEAISVVLHLIDKWDPAKLTKLMVQEYHVDFLRFDE